MAPQKFDPFTDRRARDIRNGLSATLLKGLVEKDSASVEREAEKFLAGDLDRVYVDYIRDRLTRYEKGLDLIREKGLVGLLGGSLAFWDQRLFFEVHEILEELWRPATGSERQALKGVIKAAGVYVHLERGNLKGGAKMAAKALSLLVDHGESLPGSFPLARIVEALKDLAGEPPLLLEDP